MFNAVFLLVLAESKPKKRKLSEPPSKSIPPPKKAATGAMSSSQLVVKKDTKPVVTAVKDAKSDSSFFSAPKPKPKLPSFKKAPSSTQAKKEVDPNVAQPSSIDPFREALKSMAKVRKDSPVSTPPPTSATTPPQTAGLNKLGKKKKSVSWAPESQLQSIRLIERAVYDDDPVDVSRSSLFVVFVLYINYRASACLKNRVYILHTTFVIWIAAKGLHCTPISSKKPWTGLNQFVSI